MSRVVRKQGAVVLRMARITKAIKLVAFFVPVAGLFVATQYEISFKLKHLIHSYGGRATIVRPPSRHRVDKAQAIDVPSRQEGEAFPVRAMPIQILHESGPSLHLHKRPERLSLFEDEGASIAGR
jgi:hypothetical protein